MGSNKLQKEYFKLSEEKARFYDTFFKAIGICGSIVAFFWGIHEFKVSNEREYEKEFYLERIKIMNEVVEVTSTIASYPEDDSRFLTASIELNKLRAGKLYLFSDKKLNDLMGNFFSNFNSYVATPPGVDQNTMEKLAREISEYCANRIITLTKLENEE